LIPSPEKETSFIEHYLAYLIEQFEEEAEAEAAESNISSMLNTGLGELEPGNIPNELPILPLRGLVVYPQTAVPLTIGQPRSIRLVDDAMAGNKIIGLITSRNPELENPGPEDLYGTGTVAIIHRMFRAPDGTIRLLVQGLTRFRIIEFTALEPYLRANIVVAPEIIEGQTATAASVSLG
jgi:ATP-dependent Lon protease